MRMAEEASGGNGATGAEDRQTARILVVNADDFGMSVGVNRGILEAHDRGIVRSTSLMVRRQEATRAAALALRRPNLSVGLHLDLGEWVRTDQGWEARYQRVDLEDGAAVAAEIEAQLERFRELVGRDPSHMDSHQHVHLREPVRSAARASATRLGIPLRAVTPGIRHEGGFHGQDGHGRPWPEGISPDGLIRVLAGLRPGVTELGCHPAAEPERDAYGPERVTELETLCDPAVATELDRSEIELCSFLDLNESWKP